MAERSRSEPLRFEEALLLRRARGGDVAAFEELYRQNAPRIFGLCLRMVADRARAEELTQDAFVRAWQKLAAFRGDSAFSTWLHRLAVNVVLSDQRSRSRRQAHETALDPELETVALPTARRAGRAVDLERAIAGLPPRARQVFVLFDIYGYGHQEIGDLMGISTGACKSQLSRARRLIREEIGR